MINNLFNKKIGIWGYGITGKSVLAYLKKHHCTYAVFDNKALPENDVTLLQQIQVVLYQPHELNRFLTENDYIIPSSGIDLRPYQQYAHKFVSELALFGSTWQKPLIAVTGTIGKTTITHFLSQLLRAMGKHIATGGNIGTGMLDLVEQQEHADYALLELSSFQLELPHNIQPKIAIITNIYPNHLDRHGSWGQYCAAKLSMIDLHNTQQLVLAPIELAPLLRAAGILRPVVFFATHESTLPTKIHGCLYYLESDNTIHCYSRKSKRLIAQIPNVSLSYPSNWLIIIATLDLLGMSPNIIEQVLPSLHMPDHRLNCIATHQNIRFYNDSKATIPEAMLAAVKKLDGSPIILFLGGVSKGVDRLPSLQQLKQYSIKHVICFGREAETLLHACENNNIPATAWTSIEAAFAYSTQIATAGDSVLFSPAGASFDLFAHYQARGDYFKRLVKEYINR